ncbi:Methyltransferase [Oopsacas minuta]|uniref:28S rRNA (uridine-N(3))-methyltransferase n=1 Tax=Oopsacas minuta TaxID=111878 RepID=A0AAV7KJ81_9METZ|nr:Methyltransferase [Oopsacas minuta]
MDTERRKKSRKRKLTESQLIINELDKKAAQEKEHDSKKLTNDIIPRKPTVSIALPGSILSSVPTDELKTYVIGQVARAAALFNISELIIFNEMSTNPQALSARNINLMFVHVLKYLETPQYLRKIIFPKHPDLQHVGLLHPLNCSHHMKQDEWSEYREGVVLDRPSKKKRGSYVNVGLIKDARVDMCIQPGVRVTVKMQEPDINRELRHYRGSVVSPLEPFETDIYWGYLVRYAISFSSVFSESTYNQPYDLIIGTSDKGEDISSINFPNKFKHCLIVFGGLAGLETCLEGDDELKVEDVKLLFDYYLNCCPRQGCKTIRTEEAIFITLSSLQGKLL